MSQYLPKGDFRWLEDYEIDTFDCTTISDDYPKGYVLEVEVVVWCLS